MSAVYIRFVARGSPPLQRSPLIERLLARASNSVRVLDWRADAFGLVAPPGIPMPPIAAMALRAGTADTAGRAGAAESDAWVCVATPVHLSAGMTHVTFPVEGMLQLDAMEASALAADFNNVFAGAGVRMAACGTGFLVCIFDEALQVATHDPETVVGRDVFDFQASGRDAPRLRRLGSEIEMWLFDHAVNRQRALHALPAITGLWFWGGGAAHTDIPTLPLWAAGRDVFFAAFGEAAEWPRQSGSGVVVVDDSPGSPTWPEVERRWLQPAVADLRARRLEQFHVSAAGRRFTITRGLSLRFWQRARPWWDYFDTRDGELDGE